MVRSRIEELVGEGLAPFVTVVIATKLDSNSIREWSSIGVDSGQNT